MHLSLPYLLVFTVSAAWCRSTSRREMNWHLTKFSTRKSVSLDICFYYIKGQYPLRWNAVDVVNELPAFSSRREDNPIKQFVEICFIWMWSHLHNQWCTSLLRAAEDMLSLYTEIGWFTTTFGLNWLPCSDTDHLRMTEISIWEFL